MTVDSHRVLVVTKDSKISSFVEAMLIAPVFETQIVSDFNEGRRRAKESLFNIILVDFADGEGVDFATDITDSLSTIILIAPLEHYEHVSYKVESYGVLTMSTPFDQFYFYNMIKVAIAVQYKVQVLSSQTTKLKEKMEEIRLVNRAKMLLMSNKNMTEQEAHRYIEKEAMDHCTKRILIAEQIVKKYG